jgi:ankyrin repeat protein
LEGLADKTACKRLSEGAKNPKIIKDAFTSQDVHLLMSLVNHGLDVNGTYDGYLGGSLAMDAAREGYRETFQMLLDLGADPLLRDAKGASSLHYACGRNHVGILEAFGLERNMEVFTALVEMPDGMLKSTPVMWAAERGHVNCVKYIFDTFGKGALLRTDSYRRGATHYAALRGAIDTLKYLDEVGCCMYTFEDNEGFTPLDLARTYKRTEALQFLEKKCPHPYLEEDVMCAVCKAPMKTLPPRKR